MKELFQAMLMMYSRQTRRMAKALAYEFYDLELLCEIVIIEKEVEDKYYIHVKGDSLTYKVPKKILKNIIEILRI